MITADYHMHSHHSGDSTAPTEEMIRSSIDKGLRKICFTEHNDPDFIYVKPEEKGMFDLDTDKYLEEFTRLNRIYGDRISLCFGVELGVQPDIHDKLSEYVSRYPFDFVIASSHVCQKKDPYYPSYYDGISLKEGIRMYFEEILQNVSSYPDYDIYGHLDYIVRYLPKDRIGEYTYRFEDFRDIFEVIFKKIIETGKGIELNTAGLYKGIANTNPCPEAIRFYRELGGEIITIGADAHKPEYVSYGFDKAEAILKEAGFKYYCVFEKRRPEFLNL